MLFQQSFIAVCKAVFDPISITLPHVEPIQSLPSGLTTLITSASKARRAVYSAAIMDENTGECKKSRHEHVNKVRYEIFPARQQCSHTGSRTLEADLDIGDTDIASFHVNQYREKTTEANCANISEQEGWESIREEGTEISFKMRMMGLSTKYPWCL
jgi:hypothetical protein